jgi:double-stranded uracil-DNA glycosylase
MSTVTSFNPIADKSARVLVLGSMPGVLSLKANQYYAHPRNAFWRIMSSIYGFSAEAPYESRVEKLKASGVALWDVLHVCVRVGSLDSAIEAGSRVPNDFPSFFQQHPHIKFVGFNGAEAEKCFSIYALPHLNVSGITFARLPSSSPAHAVSLEKKVAAWRVAFGANKALHPDGETER